MKRSTLGHFDMRGTRRRVAWGRGFVWTALLGLALTLPAGAGPLRSFVATVDPAYGWHIRDRWEEVEGTLYTLELTSQVWRDHFWRHQLVVAVPRALSHADTALLFIAGGSSEPESGEPRWRSPTRREIQVVRRAAREVGAPAAVLFQVPRQPLWGSLYEDAAISRTFQEYLDGAESDRILLFPMVRSAARAMDAVQELMARERDAEVRRFVVTGFSKRGWTSWLLAAVDPRVAAIAPAVIDMLNFDRHLDHHVVSFGEYSPMIRDYTEKGLHRMIETEEGRNLARLVDPYAYRERFRLPILILLGANDPYWPLDAVKFYLEDLPSEHVWVHYTPNVGHDLGDGESATAALIALFSATAHGEPLPPMRGVASETEDSIRLQVQAGPGTGEARLWRAESDTRDFRQSRWRSHEVLASEPGEPIEVQIAPPSSGYLAFFVEIDFPSPAVGRYSTCTRVFIAKPSGLVD